MVKLHESYAFEVKLGVIRSPSGARKTAQFLRQAGRGFGRRSKSSARLSGGSQYQSGLSWSRRVVVKVSIVRMAGKGAGAQRLHLKYIERDSAAPDGEKGKLYERSSGEVDSKAFEERGADDRHQFRVIVSPEDGREMESLSAVTKDLMRDMERDLGTKLDWVAADHYDTGQPHTHIVIRGKRDDGKDLVMPKDYISRGIRERAEELVTIELGRIPEADVKRKIAMGVEAERYTYLDRGLAKKCENGLVDISRPKRGQAWRAQLERRRLRTLSQMDLASPRGSGVWNLAPDFEKTLIRMGERGDIIKGLHRITASKSLGRIIDASSIYNPASENARALTGSLITSGVRDDINDKAYIVLDTADGKCRYLEIGSASKLEGLSEGMIITVHPVNLGPKPSDQTIAQLASVNDGRYSPAKHIAQPNVSHDYVTAHVRRLEAMRRAGHVERTGDGSWSVPDDYLKRASAYEKAQSACRGAEFSFKSTQTLAQMTKAIGATWLDEQLRDCDDSLAPRGFGKQLQQARQLRRQFLMEQGYNVTQGKRLNQSVLDDLETRDLASASKAYGKSSYRDYVPAQGSARVRGKYVGVINRPSGKYAVLEKNLEFTLVPWRENMDKQLGRELSGQLRSRTFSWSVERGRGLSR